MKLEIAVKDVNEFDTMLESDKLVFERDDVQLVSEEIENVRTFKTGLSTLKRFIPTDNLQKLVEECSIPKRERDKLFVIRELPSQTDVGVPGKPEMKRTNKC